MGEGGSPKDDLLNRPYLIKKTTRGGGGKTFPILRQHSLWTAPYRIHIPGYQLHLVAEKKTFHTIDCNLFQRRKFVHINDQGSYLCTILFCGLDFHYINFMQDFAFVKNQWVLLTKEL